jgi:hypothetical protein
MSESPQREDREVLEHQLEEFLAQVRSLPRGGDLEGLIEDNASQLKLLLYEVAARQRQQAAAAESADFPPSGVSALRAGDAAGR